MTFSSRLKFPSPLSPSAIEFTLSGDSVVALMLFDDQGNEVQTVFENRPYCAGTHQIMIDSLNLPAGRYFYRLTARQGDEETNETRMFERLA